MSAAILGRTRPNEDELRQLGSVDVVREINCLKL